MDGLSCSLVSTTRCRRGEQALAKILVEEEEEVQICV